MDNNGICNFGEHLTIDGYGGSLSKLNNRDVVYRCLSELPGKIGLKKLAEPHIYHAPQGTDKDPGGWSG